MNGAEADAALGVLPDRILVAISSGDVYRAGVVTRPPPPSAPGRFRVRLRGYEEARQPRDIRISRLRRAQTQVGSPSAEPRKRGTR